MRLAIHEKKQTAHGNQRHDFGRGDLVTFAFFTLALDLALTANRLGLFAGAAFAGFFEVAAQLHFTKHAFTL